jgi:hypothetical protein
MVQLAEPAECAGNSGADGVALGSADERAFLAERRGESHVVADA